MQYLEATVDEVFHLKGRTWYGLSLEQGIIAVRGLVGVYLPGSKSVMADVEVLAIRRNGRNAEAVTANPTAIVRCAVELSESHDEIPTGARLGETKAERAESYGLTKDDLS